MSWQAKSTASDVYRNVLDMLKRAGAPDDSRWISLVFYFRELKDYSHLTDTQKSRIQTLLLDALEKRDYSEEQLHKILNEYQNILVEPYKQRIDTLLSETTNIISSFHELLAARHGNVNDLEAFAIQSVKETECEQALLGRLRGAFDSLKSLLENDIRSLRNLASQDGLTSLANRRAFDAFMIPAIVRWEEERRPLAVALFDIDHFKKFNDTYGHRIGDQALQVVGKHIVRLAAPLLVDDGQAIAARYGGEEFALAVSGPGAAALPGVACDILSAMENFNFIIRDTNGNIVEGGLRITLSAGIAECYPEWSGAILENLMDCADKAMYQAKEQGRNRALIFDPGPPISFRPLPGK